MLTKVSPDKPREPTAESELAPEASAWWVRLLAAVPLSLLYGFASLLGWLAYRVFPYRRDLVRGNLMLAFPEMDEPALQRTMRDYYAGFAQMLVEIIKSAKMPAEEIRRRVRIRNLEQPRQLLDQGRSVLFA